MADHRRYRYDADGETYSSGFWNTPSAIPQHGNYEQSYPQHHQHQYYPAVSSGSAHNEISNHYNNHPAIPLSPPSSRPVSVSPDENSIAGAGGHLMPLYSTGRPSFHSSPYAAGIKPDPDHEDQQHFFQQRHHMSSEKVLIQNCRIFLK